MFIDGHKQIVDDSIKQLKINVSSDVIKELKRGIIFPDLACAKFQYNENLDEKIEVKERNDCYIAKLVKSLHGKEFGFSTIYQFQRGALTFLHSMSLYLDSPLAIVRKQILDMILAILVTIAYGGYGSPPKSAFWLGVILHTITDSYPKGHTIREGYHDLPLVKPYAHSIKIGKTKKARHEIYDLLIKLASKRTIIESETELIQELLEIISTRKTSSEITNYLKTKSKSIYHSYLIYRFIELNNRTATLYKQQLKLPKNIGIYTSKPRLYDIISFQSYDYQSSIFHKKEDFLKSTSQHEIYSSKVLPEVTKLISIFWEFKLGNISEQSFIKMAYTHIATTTFAISKSSLVNKPAFPMTGLSDSYKFKKILRTF